MSTVDRSRVEMLRQEYERQRDNLAELQRQMAELSATAVSPRREVSVTVGPQGVVTDVKFPTAAYKRLAPNELAALLMRTITEAREKVTERTAEVMAPLMPAELNVKELLSGAFSAEKLVPAEPTLPPLVQEWADQRARRSE